MNLEMNAAICQVDKRVHLQKLNLFDWLSEIDMRSACKSTTGWGRSMAKPQRNRD